jgi:hypothetical protein
MLLQCSLNYKAGILQRLLQRRDLAKITPTHKIASLSRISIRDYSNISITPKPIISPPNVYTGIQSGVNARPGNVSLAAQYWLIKRKEHYGKRHRHPRF